MFFRSLSEFLVRGKEVSMSAWLGRMPWALGGLLVGATAGAAPPSVDQLRGWVRQLDADDFCVREDASRNLTNAGLAAIEPLSEGIVSSSPEAAWRANSALEQIALRGDDAALHRVATTLQQLSQRGKPGLSGVVQELYAKQAKLRHDRAVAKIRALGGRFDGDEIGEALGEGMGGAARVIVSDEEKLGFELGDSPDKAGKNGEDESESGTVTGAADATSPSPPPDLPPPGDVAPSDEAAIQPPPDLPDDAAVPAGEIPLVAFTEVLIADAFAPPGLLELDEAGEAHESLTIDQRWRGGDAGLSVLSDVTGLTSLSLHHAPLSDVSLKYIAALPKLQSLDIEDASFTFKALAKLREHRPELHVFARGLAMLGVNADMSGPCVLTGIYAGSGAAEAGLKEGDEIVAIAGRKVRDFSDLTIAVFSHIPGEKLAIEFHREGQPRTVEVLLKERKLLEPVGR
jgi:PDZ domain-containing protein